MTTGKSEDDKAIAVGRYMLNQRDNLAECAFLVRDDWQNLGVAKALLQELVECAKAQGIRGFTADVLADNASMLHVFHRAGLSVKSRLEDGIYYLTMRFP